MWFRFYDVSLRIIMPSWIFYLELAALYDDKGWYVFTGGAFFLPPPRPTSPFLDYILYNLSSF